MFKTRENGCMYTFFHVDSECSTHFSTKRWKKALKIFSHSTFGLTKKNK